MSFPSVMDLDQAVQLAKDEIKQPALAIGVMGSYARGDAHPGSDLDLFFLSDISEVREKFFFFRGVLVETFAANGDWVQSHLNEAYDNSKWVRMFAECQPLWDESSLFDQYIALAKEIKSKSPTPLADDDPQAIQAQAKALHALKKFANKMSDPPSAIYLSGIFAKQVVDTFYEIRGIIPKPAQQLFSQIDGIDPRFSNLLRNFLESPLEQKLSIGVDLANRSFSGHPPIKRFD